MKNKQTKQRSRRLWLLLLALVIPALLLWYHHYQTNKAEHTHGNDCGCEQADTLTRSHYQHMGHMQYKYGTSYHLIDVRMVEKWDLAARSFSNEFVHTLPHRANLRDTVEAAYLKGLEERLDVINTQSLNQHDRDSLLLECSYRMYNDYIGPMLTYDEREQLNASAERNKKLEQKTQTLWLQASESFLQ